jgi:hypothetical protein
VGTGFAAQSSLRRLRKLICARAISQKATPSLFGWALAGVIGCVGRKIRSDGALGILPRDARDVRTRDSDVRELAVTKAGQLLEAVPVGAPLAQETEEVGEEHGCHHFERSEELNLILASNIVSNGAVQQILCCDAAMRKSHILGHI